MSIIYDKHKKLFFLNTPNSSYIFGIKNNKYLIHYHFGGRVSLVDTDAFEQLDDHSLLERRDCGKPLFPEKYPMEYGVFANPDLRRPSFHAKYHDGSHISDFEYIGHNVVRGKPALAGLPAVYTESDEETDTLTVELLDRNTCVKLSLQYTVFNELDVICRSVLVSNTGNQVINLESVQSVCLDLVGSNYDFIHFDGAWGRERHFHRDSLCGGYIGIESLCGSSGHKHTPFVILADKDTGEDYGRAYGASLVYSGNFSASCSISQSGNTRFLMGINSFNFGWELKPGESFQTPEVVLVYSGSGLGEMSRTYHKLYRTRLCRGIWRDRERPVLINNWEATYFNFNEEKLIDLARTASSAGIELFVLDDGWFGKRNDDNCSLGDWYPNLQKLPDGISGICNKINEIGMMFGLWLEPEMISEDSDLYRMHPDWCVFTNGRPKSYGRHQFILDLTRTDVREYIINTVSGILNSCNISYIKWDMNRYMSEMGSGYLPANRQCEFTHRYILGLYEVLETLTSRFSDVLFEGCASGGGRFDPAMLYYFPQYWTSDDTDAVERLFIQHGTSYVYPVCTMGAHISAVPNHQVSRTTPLKMRSDAAMVGQFGYELDLNRMSDDEITEISCQIKQYKELRDTLHNGDMYRLLSPFDGVHTVWEFISRDKNRVVVCVYTLKGIPSAPSSMVRLQGLDANAVYSLNGKHHTGSELMEIGLILTPYADYMSDILVFDKGTDIMY